MNGHDLTQKSEKSSGDQILNEFIAKTLAIHPDAELEIFHEDPEIQSYLDGSSLVGASYALQTNVLTLHFAEGE